MNGIVERDFDTIKTWKFFVVLDLAAPSSDFVFYYFSVILLYYAFKSLNISTIFLVIHEDFFWINQRRVYDSLVSLSICLWLPPRRRRCFLFLYHDDANVVKIQTEISGIIIAAITEKHKTKSWTLSDLKIFEQEKTDEGEKWALESTQKSQREKKWHSTTTMKPFISFPILSKPHHNSFMNN